MHSLTNLKMNIHFSYTVHNNIMLWYLKSLVSFQNLLVSSLQESNYQLICIGQNYFYMCILFLFNYFHNFSEISIIRICTLTVEISITFQGLENNFQIPVFHGSPEIIYKMCLKTYCTANLDSIFEHHRHFTNTHTLSKMMSMKAVDKVLKQP